MPGAEPAGRWGVLAFLSLGILLAEAPRFASSAVAPLLDAAWHPQGLDLATGSVLSLQTATGFVLTAATILSVGAIDPGDRAGWRIAFDALTLGPLVGVLAMWRLRQRPEAVLMAGGRR